MHLIVFYKLYAYRRYNMQFGYFDDSSKEYVITTPETPLPWINYLGCENFFSLKSNTGGGYCFYNVRIRYIKKDLPWQCHRRSF